MDYKFTRYTMVQQQIRPWDVLDPKVLDVLNRLEREHFVLEPFRKLAYTDAALPMKHNQVMLPPKIVGRILQEIKLQPNDRVLEIGTGTGYLTAAIASLAKQVITLEIFPDLSLLAQQTLKTMEIDNIQFEVGNGLARPAEKGAFDVIVLTGSLVSVPTTLLQQVRVKGRIFAILGEKPVMSAVLLTKITNERWHEHSLFETLIPPLLDASNMEAFKF